MTTSSSCAGTMMTIGGRGRPRDRVARAAHREDEERDVVRRDEGHEIAEPGDVDNDASARPRDPKEVALRDDAGVDREGVAGTEPASRVGADRGAVRLRLERDRIGRASALQLDSECPGVVADRHPGELPPATNLDKRALETSAVHLDDASDDERGRPRPRDGGADRRAQLRGGTGEHVRHEQGDNARRRERDGDVADRATPGALHLRSPRDLVPPRTDARAMQPRTPFDVSADLPRVLPSLTTIGQARNAS